MDSSDGAHLDKIRIKIEKDEDTVSDWGGIVVDLGDDDGE